MDLENEIKVRKFAEGIKTKHPRPKLFWLKRKEDVSGTSGTGIVAQGCIFDNGWCALKWLTKQTSVAFYTSIGDVKKIHGHNGKTVVVLDGITEETG